MDSCIKAPKSSVIEGSSKENEEGWRVCQTLEDWSLIHEPGVDLLLWEREIPSALSDGLSEVAWDELPNERFVAKSCEFPGVFSQWTEVPSLSPLARQLWLEDLERLTSRFLSLMNTSSLRVRLDRIDDDSCRLFHIDNMTVRLLCTYLGPSTEWLPSHQIQRVRRRHDVYEESDIRRFPRWSVGLLKGRKHPTSKGNIYHRSPPIAEIGARRFVFCLDVFNES